jgi:hypothetical protein
MNIIKEKSLRLIQRLLIGQTAEMQPNDLDYENYELRRLMKAQLQQLKDKGMPLRVMTL